MQKGLVSILTPMYNTGRYVHRLMNSVLSQTYPDIEMIVIDDGSTDDSHAVVDCYQHAFEQKGYSLKCVYQKNSGQSVAIRNGLQLINGEFLVWPDSDDFYASEVAIEKMVKELVKASDVFQMVRAQVFFLDEDTLLRKGIRGSNARVEEPQSLFYDCLYVNNGYYFGSGAYMVRTMALYETTHFDIYTSKDAGQNWQLMLPVLYRYRCKTILEPLYNTVVRKSSHSRGQYVGWEGTKSRFDAYLKTQIETLKRIEGFPKEEIDGIKTRLVTNYNKQLLRLALRENNRQGALESMSPIKDTFSYKERALYSLLCVKGGTHLLNTTILLRRLFNKLFH